MLALAHLKSVAPRFNAATRWAAARSLSTSSSPVTELKEQADVEKFRQTHNKAILYYTAAWCGPCKQIKPIYEDLARQNTHIAWGKIDVDDNPDAAVEAQIQSVPTFVGYVSDLPVKRFSGADPGQLKQMADDMNKQ